MTFVAAPHFCDFRIYFQPSESCHHVHAIPLCCPTLVLPHFFCTEASHFFALAYNGVLNFYVQGKRHLPVTLWKIWHEPGQLNSIKEGGGGSLDSWWWWGGGEKVMRVFMR